MLEKFFEGNYHWIVVIIIAIWLLDKLRPDYENKKEKAKRLKEEALKNTKEITSKIFAVPIYVDMKKKHLDLVINQLNKLK